MMEKAPNFKPEDYSILEKGFINLATTDVSFQKIDKEYLYWDRIKYLKFDALTPESAWNIIKSKRFNLEKRMSLGNIFNPLKFGYNINEYLQQKLHYLDFNFGAGIQKEKLLSDIDKEQYLNNALMEESIFSSMVEGATTTRIKAKEMLRKNKKPKNKSEQMILNNYQAIQYISEHQDEDISLEKIFDIHRLVTENTLEVENIGVFRNSNDVHVMNEITGEIVHTPPKFEELNGLMQSFSVFFNSNPKENFIHPIVKASILHFLIGYIHPFFDGNGRTARAIFYWYLLKNGYWLSEYLSISRVIMKTKVQYEKAYIYTEIDDMDVTYFIHYQVKILTQAFEDLKKYIAKKKKEQKDISKFLKLENINERQAQILFWIEKDENRFYTVKEIETIFSVTNQTARTDLEDLVKQNLLKKIAVDRKSSNYWKGDLFEKSLI
ncbi:Fic family protein [Aurantibacter crassamenti]|uniref:Fic family protein n=1 Tax=Aurantibacter crassamenti TaxID=1837375 RepID=UPI00193A7667|nr:Fic family protein [Aurantibacter crassamenti]MBM1104780.1 Fic family protein [Aurantibacter crassamenti]